jgi:hypothetical protein
MVAKADFFHDLEEIKGRVVRLIANYSKDGPKRKTPGYFEKRGTLYTDFTSISQNAG